MDYTVPGILQARTLDSVAISSPEDLPNPGIKPASPALAGRFLTTVLPVKSSLRLVDTKTISYRMDGYGPTV